MERKENLMPPTEKPWREDPPFPSQYTRLAREDWYRKKAAKTYASDEVQFDEFAKVSMPDDDSGAWVEAWVWVDRP